VSLSKSGLPYLRVSIVCDLSAVEHVLTRIVFTVENRVGSVTQNLIHELVTESLSDVGGDPEQPDRNTTLEDSVGTWTDAGTGGDEDHAPEHWSNPEDTACGNTTDPELGGWVLDDIRGPVTSAGNDD